VIYLDSCLLIYLVEGDPVFGARVAQAMNSHPEASFATSPLVEMECLVEALKAEDATRERVFRRIFISLVSLPVTRQTFEDAAVIRATYGLKTPDALHLAVARQSKCLSLWTNDNRFANAAPGFVINLDAG